MLQRCRHAHQRETTRVHVRIEIHLPCTPEAFTDEHDCPEIGYAPGGIDDHARIAGRVDDRPGLTEGPRPAVRSGDAPDKRAHLSGDQTTPDNLDRVGSQALDRRLPPSSRRPTGRGRQPCQSPGLPASAPNDRHAKRAPRPKQPPGKEHHPRS